VKTRILVLSTALLLVACGGRDDSRTMIQNKGSDTLVNVAQTWAEKYREKNPAIVVAVSGGGSGTGISALINGTVDIANASRAMKQKEVDLARKNGIEPVQHVVGYDALAVYVHQDNPVESLSLAQLAEIYGEGGTTAQWEQLGLEVPGCGSGKIVRVSRMNNSGTFAYFRKAVLGKGRDYAMGANQMHGSKDLVDLVEKTPCAIGYSGLAYATPHVKLVPIRTTEGGPAVTPTVQTAVDGSYPIARPLLMYTRGEPTGAVKEYLDWILSKEGQAIIAAKGYAPVH